MDYFYIILLALAAFFTLKDEKDAKRKKLFIGIYSVLIGVALLYLFGFSIGKYIFNLTNN
ncbi:hypothetical protein [Polaribacter uvawellassae]|uniref:hypothetical protein n=1 Tax=Polaribacter uvawellassae TaxID=3133495 RepID=UPI003218F357